MTQHSGRLVVCVALLAAACCTPAGAETASQAFARGQKLLAGGDLDAATRAFAAAASADRENVQYTQQYGLVRQVGMIRSRMETEPDPQRWRTMAAALRAFYVQQGLYPAALDVDRRAYAKLRDAASALNLAETALAMKLDAEASETLQSLDTAQRTPAVDALLGVALARQGEVAQARELAAKIVVPDDASPNTTFSVARLHAATGNTAAATAMLTRSLESVPPSRLAAFRSSARRCTEFQPLADTPGFAAALAVESKVAESACSGGSSCAGCPMRGQCPGSQGK